MEKTSYQVKKPNLHYHNSSKFQVQTNHQYYEPFQASIKHIYIVFQASTNHHNPKKDVIF